jgi:membrane-associated phospholipid phosphatase
MALALASLGAMGAVAPAGAQAADSSALHRQSLFTRHDAIVAGALVAGTLAIMPADEWLRGRFTTPSLQGNGTLHTAANDFSLLGDPGTVILSLGTYAVGRIAGSRTVSSVGLHATEALLLSAAATELMKGVVGRHRPYVLPPDQDEYSPLNGFTGAGDTSFPSGHTSAAFALASVIAGEGPVHWPHAARFVTPLSYGVATLVGLSRTYKDRHWMSDVAMGALVGEYSGLLVERYNHRHPRNALERWLVPSGVAPIAGGVALVWSAP